MLFETITANSNKCLRWEFNQNGDFEGWANNANLQANVQDGQVNYTINGGDPIFNSTKGLAIATQIHGYLRVRMRSEVAGFLEVFWGDQNGNFNATRKTTVDVAANVDFQEILVPLFEQANWVGTSARIRVDFQFPVGSQGAVDLIAFENQDLRDCNGVWNGPDDCAVLGLNEVSSKSIIDLLYIYPVPVNDVLYVGLPKGKFSDLNIELITMSGVVVYSRIYNNTPTIKLSSLPSGVYFAKFTQNNKTVVKTFVKN